MSHDPANFLVPMLLDEFDEEEQYIFMMGYEYNSVVQTLADPKVHSSSMTVYKQNRNRITAMAERSDKDVDFQSTDDPYLLQLIITKKKEKAGLPCPRCQSEDTFKTYGYTVDTYRCSNCNRLFEIWVDASGKLTPSELFIHA